MTVKFSVSISDQQDTFARRLVEEGRYASLSSVVQRGLELPRKETELKDAEFVALKALIETRMNGPFPTADESDRQTQAMIAEQKKAYRL